MSTTAPRALYKTLGAEAKLGLQIAEGRHLDTQPLNTGEFHWMNRFLQGADRDGGDRRADGTNGTIR